MDSRVWGKTGRGVDPQGDPQGDTGCRLAWSWINPPRSVLQYTPPNDDKIVLFFGLRVVADLTLSITPPSLTPG